MIEEFGAEVAGIATSVQAALAEISVTSFDCATLDLNLHGFFSLGMVKGLRDMNIPFVVCTAYGEISDCLEDIPVIKTSNGRGIRYSFAQGVERPVITNSR